MNKIQSFIDLVAWQKAHNLVLRVYKVTSQFPRTETYSLIDQMRRCSVSISSNIAEGFSRRTSKDKIQFYHMSLGSVTELQNQLLVAKDVGYLEKIDFKDLADQTVEVSKLINGLIKKLRNT